MDSQALVFSPSNFVDLINQNFEFSLPWVAVEGELAEFSLSKDKWLYFKLKDSQSSLKCFGVKYMLPGPVEEGMLIRVTGSPRLHRQYGFSFNVQTIEIAGKGDLKASKELLKLQLAKEGLFASERKRLLPYPPNKIGLITSAEGAAVKDFKKVINSRWPFLEVWLFDSIVQGRDAPQSLVSAIDRANQTSGLDLLVITRGGGGSDDLAAFDHEQVIRAVATSRLPTIVAIGHEQDIALSELAADKRASTPSNAAEILVPERKLELANLKRQSSVVRYLLDKVVEQISSEISNYVEQINSSMKAVWDHYHSELQLAKVNLRLLDPQAVLKRGYALVYWQDKIVTSRQDLKIGDKVVIRFSDGQKQAQIED